MNHYSPLLLDSTERKMSCWAVLYHAYPQLVFQHIFCSAITVMPTLSHFSHNTHLLCVCMYLEHKLEQHSLGTEHLGSWQSVTYNWGSPSGWAKAHLRTAHQANTHLSGLKRHFSNALCHSDVLTGWPRCIGWQTWPHFTMRKGFKQCQLFSLLLPSLEIWGWGIYFIFHPTIRTLLRNFFFWE